MTDRISRECVMVRIAIKDNSDKKNYASPAD
jgi:hypothetical protein